MLIDAHNHLDLYGDNLDRALKIIEEKEIWTLACSMNEQDYLWLKELSRDRPNIIPCYGIHPWEVGPGLDELKNKEKIRSYIEESPIIGEIGLDFFWAEDKKSYPLQLEVFDFFLREAKNLDKIVNLHTKGAEKEVLELLKKYDLRTPIIHWYSGPLDLVGDFMKLDCYWTISVDITESHLTRELVEILPIDKLLTETDGPTALEWINGNYAYPDYVENIVHEIARIKKLDYEDCKKQINNNFKELVKEEPWIRIKK